MITVVEIFTPVVFIGSIFVLKSSFIVFVKYGLYLRNISSMEYFFFAKFFNLNLSYFYPTFLVLGGK